MGALVEIQDVAVDVPPDAPLAGAHLDLPQPAWLLDAAAVDLHGWVVGEGVEAVEIRENGVRISATPLWFERPDLVETFPDYPEALRSGFRTKIDLLGTPSEFELEAWVSFSTGDDVLIATLTGRHRWRRQGAPGFAELASIVISCRDEARLLAETLESVLAQTYPHLEVVLIDGSSDGRPREVAEAFEDVRVFVHESRGTDPYTQGIRHTNGDFLAFADAGDLLLPHALSTGIALLEERPDWAFARGRCRAISPDGSPLPALLGVRDEATDPYETLLRGSRDGPAAASVYRRAVFEDVDAFDSSLGHASNLDLDLRISSRYAAGLHDEIVADYRLDADNARKMMKEGLAALARQRGMARRSGRGEAYRYGRKARQRSWKAIIAQQTQRWR